MEQKANITIDNHHITVERMQTACGREIRVISVFPRHGSETVEDIELVVVLPFEGHDAKWDERSKRRMDFLRQMCSECVVIGTEDCRESYIMRNCYMVDHADHLVAVYDNERNLRSGTMQCVRYARKKQVPVILIHPDTAMVTW